MSDHEQDQIGGFIVFVLLPLLFGVGCCGLAVVGVGKAWEAAGGAALAVLLLVGVVSLLVRLMTKDKA